MSSGNGMRDGSPSNGDGPNFIDDWGSVQLDCGLNQFNFAIVCFITCGCRAGNGGRIMPFLCHSRVMAVITKIESSISLLNSHGAVDDA